MEVQCLMHYKMMLGHIVLQKKKKCRKISARGKW